MLRVKAPFSIFNGYETFQAGDIATVSGDQAKRIVLTGGHLVDAEDSPLPIEDAVRTLRISQDDLAMAEDGALRAQVQAAIDTVNNVEE